MAVRDLFVLQPGEQQAGSEALQPIRASRWQDLILRAGFLCSGSLLLYWAMQAWARSQIGLHHEVVAMVMITYVLAFILLGAAVLNVRWLPRLEPLIPVAVLLTLSFSLYVGIQYSVPFYRTDTITFSHGAAQALLDGENPFSVQSEERLTALAEDFGVPATFVTPTTEGGAIDRLLSWPAGHFLPFVIPLGLGLTDLRWVVAAFEVATLLVLWLAAPATIRPLVFIPLFIDPDQGVNFTVGGGTDFIWVLPVVGLALLLRARRFLPAAILFGLAAGTKQQPWMLAPFLAIWVWHQHSDQPVERRFIEVGKFAAGSLAAFLALNLPFFVWDPSAWLASVLLPFRESLVPFGSGLSLLTQLGIADLPKSFYSVATFGVWGVLVLAYAVHFKALRLLIWLFPAIILWFSYRSLQSYFVYWVPLLMVALYYWWDEVAGTDAADAS